MNHAYTPDAHLTYKDGLLVANISKEFADDIMDYFKERREDD
jgi:hypothetical protein